MCLLGHAYTGKIKSARFIISLQSVSKVAWPTNTLPKNIGEWTFFVELFSADEKGWKLKKERKTETHALAAEIGRCTGVLQCIYRKILVEDCVELTARNTIINYPDANSAIARFLLCFYLPGFVGTSLFKAMIFGSISPTLWWNTEAPFKIAIACQHNLDMSLTASYSTVECGC